LGLVPEERREAVLATLVQAVRGAGDRVTAGDVGFTYVVQALSDGGQGGLLFRLVTQPEGPGYADQLRKGATALTEAWDANPASSHNHCMLGHAEEWFYRGLAGILPDPAAPGFKHFFLKPQLVGDLTWARADYDSVYGRIASHWKIEDQRVVWEISVPPNTSATVTVPTLHVADVTESERPLAEVPGIHSPREENGQVVLEVGSGTYRFIAPRDTNDVPRRE
jgi:hypothetical protein